MRLHQNHQQCRQDHERVRRRRRFNRRLLGELGLVDHCRRTVAAAVAAAGFAVAVLAVGK